MFAMVLNVATCHFLSAPLIITAHHTRKTRTGETNEFPSHPPLQTQNTCSKKNFSASVCSPLQQQLFESYLCFFLLFCPAKSLGTNLAGPQPTILPVGWTSFDQTKRCLTGRVSFHNRTPSPSLQVSPIVEHGQTDKIIIFCNQFPKTPLGRIKFKVANTTRGRRASMKHSLK